MPLIKPRLASTATGPIHQLMRRAEDVILGKQDAIQQAVACLLARGHLLIEDLPGVGKTTLAHLLAQLFGLQFQRIQFTSDLLPADIIGATIYDRDAGSFHFHPGPVFAQLVLADEVNRATPKTQSALLEAMEERQVTVEGDTRALPEPFFVVATQNPGTQIGTFPLPESQLDRFLMRIQLGYPDRAAEHDLLMGRDRRELLREMQPMMAVEDLIALQRQVDQVHVANPIADYVQALMDHTRGSEQFHTGLSPRAGLALLRAARAWALLESRDAVLPEDIQHVFVSVACHRLHAVGGTPGQHEPRLAAQVLEHVPVP